MRSPNSIVSGQRANRRIAVSFGTVIALLMALVLILWQRSSTELSEQHEREVESSMIDMLSTSVEKASASGKFHVRLLVDEIAKQERVRYVIVSDEAGRIAAHSDQRLNGNVLDSDAQDLIEEVLASDSPIIRDIVHNNESVHQLASVVNWGFDDHDRRVIFLGLSRTISESRQSSAMWSIGLLVALLTLFSVVAVFVISNILGREIRTMAEQLDGILKASPLLIRIENAKGELLVKSTAYDRETRDASNEELTGLQKIIKTSYKVAVPDEKNTWTTHNNNSFAFTSFPLGDTGSSKAAQICSVGLNTTKEKAAEEALRDNEQRLRVTLDSIADAVVTIDAECTIRTVNPVALVLCEGTLERVVGMPVHEVFAADSLQPLSSDSQTIRFQSTKIVRDTLKQSNGNELRIEWLSAPMIDSKGDEDGFVLVFRDVTEKLRVENELRQTQKEESIGRLAGGIAHDFNNMLGGVMGAVGLLQLELSSPDKSIDTKECSEYVDLIMTSTERAAELTGQLLAFSRKGPTQLESVDVHKVIQENIALLQSGIDKRLEIGAELTADSPIVLGERSGIQNAILNLGINARDAIESSGVITISTKTVDLDTHYCESSRFPLDAGSYIRISVRDSGKGMSVEQQRKIFEPYYTTKELGKGTGLGLASVYGTIIGHKGAIEVFSKIDEGSVFHLFLPLLGDTRVSKARQSTDAPTGKGMVLLVEDEKIVRLTTSRMLKSLGYGVVTAKDGQEAIDVLKVQADAIDLVMTDMIMPRLDGEAVFRFVQENSPEIPVVIVSGYTQDHSIEALTRDGLRGFLPKPYDLKALATIVSAAFRE